MSNNDSGTLRIGHLSTAYHTSFILMGMHCIEKKLGIKTQWHMSGGGPAIVSALGRGELDLGYIGLPPVMIGIDKGIDVRCVGGGHVEGTVFIGDAGMKTLDEVNGDLTALFAQIEGGTIGCPPSGSIHDVIIRDCLKQSGVCNVSVRNYDWADLIPEAMLDGEIDAAVGTPPLSIAAKNACNAKIIIPAAQLWPYNPSYGIIASRKMIDEQPELIEAFLQIHEDACNLIRHQPERAAAVVENEVGVMDVDFIMQAYAISPRYCASLPPEYVQSTMAFVPVLRDMGYISRDLGADEIFDMRFVENVHTERAHY